MTRNAGIPCVVSTGDGYRMYYSANVVFHRDLGFCEPRHIGVASAGDITGPYRKSPEPTRAHVFLLGFLRSGTTLLEQVLASHGDVVALEEKDTLADIQKRSELFDAKLMAQGDEVEIALR